MGKDVGWKVFFSDDARLADFINGVGCEGEQVVTKEDLHDMDTQVWLLRGTKLGRKISAWKTGNVKIRDMVRKVAFGVNFAIIGVENQENLDYSIPVKSMAYDVGTYEMQASKIRKEVRKNRKDLSAGEYLYGFRKESKLHPTVTFILYTGEKEWDGPMSLHDMLDFTDIPMDMQKFVADYKINLINIRKLKDTSVFRTDVKQVFDFIRCASDSKALKALVENDDYYKRMDEEAFDVAVQYTKARELIEAKEYLEEDGGFDMCKGLTDLIAEGRAEGHAEGRAEGLAEGKVLLIKKKLDKGQSIEQIAEALEENVEAIESLIEEYLK